MPLLLEEDKLSLPLHGVKTGSYPRGGGKRRILDGSVRWWRVGVCDRDTLGAVRSGSEVERLFLSLHLFSHLDVQLDLVLDLFRLSSLALELLIDDRCA